jgi:hypothetical protein
MTDSGDTTIWYDPSEPPSPACEDNTSETVACLLMNGEIATGLFHHTEQSWYVHSTASTLEVAGWLPLPERNDD